MTLTAVMEAVVETVRTCRVVRRVLRLPRAINLAGPLDRARACLWRHDGQTKGHGGSDSDSEETVLATNGNLGGI